MTFFNAFVVVDLIVLPIIPTQYIYAITLFHSESQNCNNGACFSVQHLIRKLGSEPYVGQRVILLVSQGISSAAESLLFMDPFDDAFPNLHNCMYIM